MEKVLSLWTFHSRRIRQTDSKLTPAIYFNYSVKSASLRWRCRQLSYANNMFSCLEISQQYINLKVPFCSIFPYFSAFLVSLPPHLPLHCSEYLKDVYYICSMKRTNNLLKDTQTHLCSHILAFFIPMYEPVF